MSRAELIAMRRKLSDTFDWLDPGDCGIGSPEMQVWESRLDRLQDLMDNIDERLNPEDPDDLDDLDDLEDVEVESMLDSLFDTFGDAPEPKKKDGKVVPLFGEKKDKKDKKK